MSTVKVDTIQTTGGVSEIAIDKLKGVSAASSISVVAEGGTTTTNLQQGLAKMWVNYTGISTTAARDSFNVSSLTDEGTGQTTVNINNDMGSANYSGYYYTSASTGTSYGNFGNAFTGGFGSFAAGSCSQNAYTSTNFDSYQNLVGIFGDLA
jgi:hypothetical protein|tara:strand:- start:245 stop:700 length:456 start_codon:yes stop_codon:yes gene_type:complete